LLLQPLLHVLLIGIGLFVLYDAPGPEVSYQFVQNPKRPVTLDLRWYHEFEVKNRLEGDSVFLTISFPLAITEKPRAEQDWTQPGGQTLSQ
jgi:hypothetical protein